MYKLVQFSMSVCVQRTVDRALSLDPYDAFAWVIRGRWSYEVRPPLLSSRCTHHLPIGCSPCPGQPPRPAPTPALVPALALP